MPMYPYGGESENAPSAGMMSEGGSNEVIPNAVPAAVPISEQTKGFPLPGLGLPQGIFDSNYSSGRVWTEPGETSGPTNWQGGDSDETVQQLPIQAPPQARPATG